MHTCEEFGVKSRRHGVTMGGRANRWCHSLWARSSHWSRTSLARQSGVISVLASASALLVGAAIVGRVTSRPLVRSGLRQLALGAAAAAVTSRDRSGDRGVNAMTAYGRQARRRRSEWAGPMALAASDSGGKGSVMVVAAPAPSGDLDVVGAAGLTCEEVLSGLGSGFEGLSSDDAADRLRQFGPNALATHRVRASAVLFRQIRNPILVMLLAAALVSALTGGGTNAVIIVVIVALSVGLGFFNEYRAEMAMEALRANIRHEAEVLRDGRSCRVPVTNLVPGDVVSLRIGALVPADLRLLSVEELECDEGVLTGESMPVAKSAEAVAGRPALDQPGCVFMGTIVHQGSALGVVVRTGARTAFGRIAAGLSEKQGQTAFEVGLSQFSRFLFAVAAVLTAFIFIVNVALSRPLIEALLFSLAIAVGIAPEMMPAIVTVSLSAGSRALAAKKVLVKRLVAIEDLGNIEILFTDKTGTLTEGVITFERGPRRRRAAERPPAAVRAGLQRSHRHRRRTGRGERLGPGAVVGTRGGDGRRGRPGGRRLRATGRPSLRPRTAAGLGAGHRPRRQTAADHQGRPRSDPGSLRERSGRRPTRPGGTFFWRGPSGSRGRPTGRGRPGAHRQGRGRVDADRVPDLRGPPQSRRRLLHRPAPTAGSRGEDHHRRQRPGGRQGVLGHRGRLRRRAQRRRDRSA